MSDSSAGDRLGALYARHGPDALRLAYLLTGDRELPPLSPRARRRIRARRSAAIMASVVVVAGIAAGVVIGVQALTQAVPPQVSPRPPATAYVLSGSGTVTPIRTATNTTLPPIKLRHVPAAIAITPDGKTAYAVNFAGGRGVTVTPIRTATNTALRPIKVGRGSCAIAITGGPSPHP